MGLNSLSVWIAGAAELGAEELGTRFLRGCARAGLQAYGYASRESGPHGHVLFQAEVGVDKVWTQSDTCEVLVALDAEALRREGKDAGWAVLCRPDLPVPELKA